ncbi:alanine racemase [Rickettsiales bacterium LUAb2]
MKDIKELVSQHGSVITINTNNIKQNYQSLQNMAKNSVVAPVLKSNAYGVKLPNVIQILDEVKCNNYFVSTLDEGIIARNNSKNSNIYILHGIFGNNEEAFLEYKLTPVINNVEQLEKWVNFSKIKQKKLDCIIHLDTGINRLGLQKDEITYLIENFEQLNKYINILYFISHLACSDNNNNPANQAQYDLFIKITNNFPHIKRSLAASFAIYFKDDYAFDMIRPGFALYGSNPLPNQPNPLLPVIDYYTSIIQINNIKKGEKIGYTHSWEAPKDSIVATVTLGYADGILRSCSNSQQAYFYIGEEKVPVVGTISMDMLMIDITNLKQKVKLGDPVEVIGKHQDIDQFAAMNNTINCEALNLIGLRYPKIYY